MLRKKMEFNNKTTKMEGGKERGEDNKQFLKLDNGRDYSILIYHFL